MKAKLAATVKIRMEKMKIIYKGRGNVIGKKCVAWTLLGQIDELYIGCSTSCFPVSLRSPHSQRETAMLVRDVKTGKARS